jgi:hypothetical protein
MFTKKDKKKDKSNNDKPCPNGKNCNIEKRDNKEWRQIEEYCKTCNKIISEKNY